MRGDEEVEEEIEQEEVNGGGWRGKKRRRENIYDHRYLLFQPLPPRTNNR